MSKIILTSGAAPSTPTSGTVALYSDANDTLRFKDDTGADIGIVTVSVGGITTLDKLQFEDHGSNAQMWLIEEDGGGTNALVFDYSGTERLRITPSGDIADSNNNVVLSFSSTNEDGVNWVDVKNNSTGSGPIVSAVGADTNIDLTISAKGTGVINLGSGGVKLNAPLDANSQTITGVASFIEGNGIALTFSPGAEEGANWVDVKWSESGQSPVVRVLGSDSNIDLKLDTKGTGDIDASSNKIINLATPQSSEDAATKDYVDIEVAGAVPVFRLDAGPATTVLPGDAIVVLSSGAPAQTATLPLAAGVPPGTIFTLKNGAGTSAAVILPSGGDTIDFVGGPDAGLLVAPFAFTRLIGDGAANWYVA